MATRLGPLEVVCDAPPYPVVGACKTVGIVSPEDVRWCRLSDRRREEATARWSDLPAAAWRAVTGRSTRVCPCKQHLPPLMRNTFEFADGHEVTYLMAQCPRCLTVYWEETPEPNDIY